MSRDQIDTPGNERGERSLSGFYSCRIELPAGRQGLGGSYIDLLSIGPREIGWRYVDLDLVDGAGEREGRLVVCADG